MAKSWEERNRQRETIALRANGGFESGAGTVRTVAVQKGGHLVAVAADGHGAPAAAMRTGIIVKEETAGGIGAAANGRVGSFDNKFGGGAS